MPTFAITFCTVSRVLFEEYKFVIESKRRKTSNLKKKKETTAGTEASQLVPDASTSSAL